MPKNVDSVDPRTNSLERQEINRAQDCRGSRLPDRQEERENSVGMDSLSAN